MITKELQARLVAGAQALRDNPDAIDHHRLACMVADWLDAEALMWEVIEDVVELLGSFEVTGSRGCSVHLVADPDGRVATHGDTTSHAERIVAALPESLLHEPEGAADV